MRRCLFSLDYEEDEFEQASSRLHLGCISAVSRLYPGCISEEDGFEKVNRSDSSAVPRLHLGHTSAASRQVTAKLIDAAAKMKADGWWHDSLTHPALRRKVVAENARALCAALVSRLFGRGPPPPRFVPSAALRRA